MSKEFTLSLQSTDEFFWCYELLFARLHILQCHLASSYLIVAGEDHKGNLLGIGIRHLLLHLGTIRINLSTNAFLAYLIYNRQAVLSTS